MDDKWKVFCADCLIESVEQGDKPVHCKSCDSTWIAVKKQKAAFKSPCLNCEYGLDNMSCFIDCKDYLDFINIQ